MFDALQFDAQGNRIWPGKTVRRLEWSVINDTALPSWLTFTNADSANLALTVNPVSNLSSDGYVQLTWSNTPTVGVSSSISTSFALDPRQYHEIGLLFEDVWVGTDLDNPTKLDMAFALGKFPVAGFWIKSNRVSGKMSSRIYNGGSVDNDDDLPYQILGNGFGNGKKNLGFSYCQSEKRIHFLAGQDAPQFTIEPSIKNGANSSWPNISNGSDMPKPELAFQWASGAAGAQSWLRFSGVKLWLVTG